MAPNLKPIFGPNFGSMVWPQTLVLHLAVSFFRSKNGPQIGTRNINRKHNSRAQFVSRLYANRKKNLPIPVNLIYSWADQPMK